MESSEPIPSARAETDTARGGRPPRVLVTGLGAVTPFAPTLTASVRRLVDGASALVLDSSLDGDPRRVGRIADFEPRAHFRLPKALKLSDRKTQLGVAAAAMALADAGISPTEEPRSRLGVLFGSAATDLEIDRLAAAVGPDPEMRALDDLPWFAERALRRLYPLWLLVNLPNMLSAQIGIQISSTGPNHTLLTEWIAGAQAIGEAFLMLRGGEVDAMVAGGAEAPLSPIYAGCLDAQGLGDGLVLADAAAAMVLEREDTIDPHRRVYAEITGYATAGPGSPRVADPEPAIMRAAHAALAMHDLEREPNTAPDAAPWLVARFGPPAADRAGVADRLLTAGSTALPLQDLMGHPLGAAGAVAATLGIGVARERGATQLLCLSEGYTGVACALTVRLLENRAGTPGGPA